MIVLAVLVLALAAEQVAPAFQATVVGVADGDTITVLRDRQQIRIRLDGIDCPEGGQAFSNRAKQFTSALVFSRQVAQAEIEARNAKRGLWSDPHAVAPWEFRHPPSGMQSSFLPLVRSTGNLRSKVFHAPGCASTTSARIAVCRSPPFAEAEAAGYRRHAACVR